MITLKQAVKIAKKRFKKDYGTTLIMHRSVLDDGEYYIFDTVIELDESVMIAVSKEDGKITYYFPPDHLENYLKAKELKF